MALSGNAPREAFSKRNGHAPLDFLQPLCDESGRIVLPVQDGGDVGPEDSVDGVSSLFEAFPRVDRKAAVDGARLPGRLSELVGRAERGEGVARIESGGWMSPRTLHANILGRGVARQAPNRASRGPPLASVRVVPTRRTEDRAVYGGGKPLSSGGRRLLGRAGPS